MIIAKYVEQLIDIFFLFILFYVSVFLYVFFFEKKIYSEKVDLIYGSKDAYTKLLFPFKDIFSFFYYLSLISSIFTIWVVIKHFCCHFLKNIKNSCYLDCLFGEFIYLLVIFVILIFIFYLYPHINKTNYCEINSIYGNRFFKYEMFFNGYKGHQPQRILLLSIISDTDNMFSVRELKIMHDFLVKLRCIYSDFKTIFWFPEIFFITFLLYLLGDDNHKMIILFVIFLLLVLFFIKIYAVVVLLHLYRKPFNILISPSQTEFLEIKLERKLVKILKDIKSNNFKIPTLKLLREFLPILGN